jgi:TolA-binding protein
MRNIALGLALILPSGALAMAQTPAGAQAQLSVAGNGSKTGKENRKGGRAANDRAKDGKDNAELLEEMRQMRQLIERLESRISQLEAEKSEASGGVISRTSRSS